MNNKVFIIGNGFDLDLGWRTDYQSFIESDYWPLRHQSPNCPMAKQLQKSIKIERWVDLESFLKDYSKSYPNLPNYKAEREDEAFFNELKSSLYEYLKHEEKKEIKKDSMSVRVLRAIIENGFFNSIYTFNYTNIREIAKKADIDSSFKFEYVHGSISDNSIILGIDDKSEVREGYSYLRKTFSEFYSSHPIRYDLQECDEVVLFGHSLGDNDYPYFSDFFRMQSNCSSRNNSKYITLFTKDNRSRIQILDQLRSMNNAQTERLINDNIFSIIMTDQPDIAALNRFFDHINKTSKKAENERITRSLSVL